MGRSKSQGQSSRAFVALQRTIDITEPDSYTSNRISDVENQAQSLSYFVVMQISQPDPELDSSFLSTTRHWLPDVSHELDMLSSNEFINFLQTFCVLQAEYTRMNHLDA